VHRVRLGGNEVNSGRRERIAQGGTSNRTKYGYDYDQSEPEERESGTDVMGHGKRGEALDGEETA